jgi:two-component system phosphate regulon sensor histidine kinase PhoR
MRQHQEDVFEEVASSPMQAGLEQQLRFARGTGEHERIARSDAEPTAEFSEELEQIVHDLKGPLQAIALETFLLDEKIAPELRAAVTRISRNAFFLDRILQDLADACSIDAGRFEVRKKRTELRALIERATDRLVPARDRARVSLQAPRAVTVSIDELRIERVFANLLQNALKYAPRSSRIAIRLDVSERVRVSVFDAGPGISIAETPHVFDKYRRGKSASGQGSGLGLYISKQIVEAHGGTIGATSIEGAGSVFFFVLPML